MALATGRLWPVALWILGLAVAQALVAERRLRGALPDPALLRPGRRGATVDRGRVLALGATNLFVTAYHRLDTVLVAALLDARAAGHYTAAYAVMLGTQAAPAMLANALQPVLARTHGTDPARFHEARRRTLAALVLSTLPVALAGSLVAGPLVEAVSGPGFGEAGDALAVLLWILPVVALSLVADATLRAARRERTLARVAGVALVVDVAANLSAIPAPGIVGAAVVTLATEALVAASLLAAARGAGPRAT